MPQNPMYPRMLTCAHCAETAVVKAYLPIYADGWALPPAEEPVLKSMTCAIYCPRCGARNQTLPVTAA
jgi:hypothetical protein